ncbi:MAG: hypothetical protein ACFE0J_04870 [Elainellaceae cyanobacterium]
MNDVIRNSSASSIPPSQNSPLGDRIRTIANQLRQEDEVQIKATSRILGAAAKLAENHDRLIDEVVEMVEDDLDQAAQFSSTEPYTVEQLQQQFKNFNDAKAHFNLTARSWASLVDKLNEQSHPPQTTKSPAAKTPQSTLNPPSNGTQDAVVQRLGGIERDIQMMRGDLNQMLKLLEQLVKQVSN